VLRSFSKENFMPRRYALFCASILTFLSSASVISAQCTRATNGFVNIAVVLASHSFVRDNKTLRKSQTSLSSLERTEPDFALFQIPPDYTISELVPDPPMRRPGFLSPVSNAPAGPSASPQ